MDRERFTALWVRSLNAGTADDADDVFSKVLAHYCESHRRYHTPQHIDHCLRQFDLALDHVEGPRLVLEGYQAIGGSGVSSTMKLFHQSLNILSCVGFVLLAKEVRGEKAGAI